MKKRSALLVTLAVVCATLAVAPGTASAQSKVPNVGSAALGDPHTPPSNESVMTACPMSSAPAAGFSDTTSTDVDCIKMFGITQGTSATTYGPDESIPRWQMALFLHRMFVPTGLAAAGTTTVPAFTDTADLSAEIQAAITAIASHGITVGTSATTFGPNDNVTREQMALFLYRFGKKIKPYNTATDVTGIFDDAAADIASGSYNFSDIAGATFEGMEAIIAMYNIGATAEACTATTIAAFIPLGTWPGIIGEFMIYFPITLSAILGSSLIVAIFFNSMLVSNFMTVEENELNNKNLYRATYFLGSIGIIFLIFSSTRIFGSLFLLITIFLWLYKIFLKKQIDKFKDKILPVLENNYSKFLVPDLNFMNPVEGIISSRYGKKRYINDQPRSPHLSLDIAAAEGTKIVSPTKGKVILVGDFFYAGNYIIIDHGFGLISSYSHLSSVLVNENEFIQEYSKILFL